MSAKDDLDAMLRTQLKYFVNGPPYPELKDIEINLDFAKKLREQNVLMFYPRIGDRHTMNGVHIYVVDSECELVIKRHE